MNVPGGGAAGCILLTLAAGCSSAIPGERSAVPGAIVPFSESSRRSAASPEILVENEWTTVARVFLVVPGGSEVRLGRVEARQAGTFRIPLGWTTGMVQLVARPNAVWNAAGSYQSEPFAPVLGMDLVWTLRDRPAASVNSQEYSPVRVVGCGRAC